MFYFKDRPRKQTFSNILERIDASSFPSLHAARVTFLGGSLIYFFKNHLVTFLIMFFIGIVFYTRILLKKHDWIDIIAGLFVGLAVTAFVITFFNYI